MYFNDDEFISEKQVVKFYLHGNKILVSSASITYLIN